MRCSPDFCSTAHQSQVRTDSSGSSSDLSSAPSPTSNAAGVDSEETTLGDNSVSSNNDIEGFQSSVCMIELVVLAIIRNS